MGTKTHLYHLLNWDERTPGQSKSKKVFNTKNRPLWVSVEHELEVHEVKSRE